MGGWGGAPGGGPSLCKDLQSLGLLASREGGVWGRLGAHRAPESPGCGSGLVACEV